MTRYPHGPDCIACTDPAAAAEQITVERIELDALAEQSREHRAEADRLAAKYWRPSDWTGREWADGQALMLGHAGTANALACRVQQARAHIERVLAAHPVTAERVREALAEARNLKETQE